MDILDLDLHIRRMERASTSELDELGRELQDFLANGSTEEKQQRVIAYKQALQRLHARSEAELTMVKELLASAEKV